MAGCGAIDCVNNCDGDFTHETCPNVKPARLGLTDLETLARLDDEDARTADDREDKMYHRGRAAGIRLALAHLPDGAAQDEAVQPSRDDQ